MTYLNYVLNYYNIILIYYFTYILNYILSELYTLFDLQLRT